MAHPQQRLFCSSVRERFPEHFSGIFALDIGSLDINGNNQFLFDVDCLYLGLDLASGKNVDLVTPAHLLGLPDETFDTIVSTECLEHDRYYAETLKNIVRLLKPGGLFLMSCATTGRPEHGTLRTTPQDAPLLQQFDNEWANYYRNITEEDVRAAIDINKIFSNVEFSIGHETNDLYFFGVKQGRFKKRSDSSWLLDCSPRHTKMRDLRSELETAHATSQNLYSELETAHATSQNLYSELETAHASNQNLRRELDTFFNSKSWRITHPLRVAMARVKIFRAFGIRSRNALRYILRDDFYGAIRRRMRSRPIIVGSGTAKSGVGVMVLSAIRGIYQRLPLFVQVRAAQQRIARWIVALPQELGHSTQNGPAHHDLVKRRNLSTRARSSVTSVFPAIDLSVVTYNSEKWVRRCLASLQSQSYPASKIHLIFVDHGSADCTVALLREAQAGFGSVFASFSILEQANLGFGAGHDRAIRALKSEFLLVSNIDLEFTPDSIATVVAAACSDDPGVAAWELRQVPHEHPKHYDPVTLETNWQSHACVLMRRAAYEQVGGYDNQIFMYAEDVELSYRFRSHGYVLRYCPTAVVHHHSYEDGKPLLKPLQYTGGTFGNAAIRLRYGDRRDRAAAFVALFWLAVSARQPFPGSRRAAWANLLKLMRQTGHFWRGKGSYPAYFPFRFFDYEMTRDGALYKVDPIEHGPLVSIITRTYEAPGRDKLLKQAGRCIINQTYRDIEWIVVQDGGESLREVALAIADLAPWMTVRFVAGPKKGRSFAGNIGLDAAHGDYCMFLDDDDLLYADHVETLVATLRSHPKACAAYALSFEVRSECTETGCKEEPYTTPASFWQPWDYTVIEDHNFIPIQSLLFSRKLFLERGGFDTDLEQLEDWNLWLRYGLGNTFEFVPKTTSLFRTPSHQDNRLRRQLALHSAYDEAKKRAALASRRYMRTTIGNGGF